MSGKSLCDILFKSQIEIIRVVTLKSAVDNGAKGLGNWQMKCLDHQRRESVGFYNENK